MLWQQRQQDKPTIRDLYNQHNPIDLVTVVEKLSADGKLDEVGGAAYLAALSSRVGAAAHVEYYCKVLKEKFLQRSLITASYKIIKESFKEGVNVENLADMAQTEVYNATELKESAEAQNISGVINKVMSDLEKLQSQNGRYSGVPSGFPTLDDIKRLETQYDASNAYALEALIRAEIFRKNPERAARYFNDIDLAPEHPQRRAIQDAILYEAFALGNWEILHAIDHDFPANAQIFDAMRFIDAKRAQTSYVSTPAQGLFQYAKTPTFAAAQRTDTSKLPAHSLNAIAKIDDIYRDAYHGMLDTALQKVRNADVIKSHPYEALILQSAILSAQGKNADAALVLSGDFNDGYRSLPLNFTLYSRKPRI